MNKCFENVLHAALALPQLKWWALNGCYFSCPFGSIRYYYYITVSDCVPRVINCKHIANRDINFYCRFNSFVRAMEDEAASIVIVIADVVVVEVEKKWKKLRQIIMKLSHSSPDAIDVGNLSTAAIDLAGLPTNQRVKYFINKSESNKSEKKRLERCRSRLLNVVPGRFCWADKWMNNFFECFRYNTRISWASSSAHVSRLFNESVRVYVR